MSMVAVLLLAALTKIGVAASPDQSEAAVLLLIISASWGAEIEPLGLLGESLWLRLKPCQRPGMMDQRLKF